MDNVLKVRELYFRLRELGFWKVWFRCVVICINMCEYKIIGNCYIL